MSVKVGELYASLGLDDSGFQQGMAQAENRSGRLMDVLKVGVAGAAAAVGAAFIGMAKTGAENVAAIEDATHRFQSETGAAEEEAERFSDTIQN